MRSSRANEVSHFLCSALHVHLSSPPLTICMCVCVCVCVCVCILWVCYHRKIDSWAGRESADGALNLILQTDTCRNAHTVMLSMNATKGWERKDLHTGKHACFLFVFFPRVLGLGTIRETVGERMLL